MAVNPAVVKLIITAATDKRTWIVIGSIVRGIILMIVGIVAAFLNIFSFDDSGSSTASAAYVQFIDDMKYAYYATVPTKEEKDRFLYLMGERNAGDEEFYGSYVDVAPKYNGAILNK